MTSPHFSSDNLDHLGIIAGICHKIDLVTVVDEFVEDHDREVSTGEALLAMVLNALGFLGRPLYLTPEFFNNKPLDRLIRPGLLPEQLNDDRLGRALDEIFEAGPTELFYMISRAACEVFGLQTQAGHLDSTSISFEGRFVRGPDREQAVHLTHGYSKDERPDLKQLVVSLICAYKSSIPLWFEALDGNSSDKSSFPDTVEGFLEQLDSSQPFIIIADSALYSRETVARLDEQIDFVTRVPATLKAVKQFYEDADLTQMTPCEHDARYHYQWHESDYGGVEQRWLLVHSAAARESKQASLEGKRSSERERIAKQLRAHAREHFSCERDALASLEKLASKWSWHQLTGSAQVTKHERYARPGRPAKDDEPEVSYTVETEVEEDAAAMEKALDKAGYFVLATNVLDKENLDAEQMLEDYKSQNNSVERGFRFLKDPKFFADGLYLQKESRITAMMMVMTVGLLMYSLAEHHLRQQLVEQDEYVPDQKGKPTQRITIRRVFQMFEGITVLRIEDGTSVSTQVLNMEDVHAQILRLLGSECQNIYANPP